MIEIEIAVKQFIVNRIYCKCPNCKSIEIEHTDTGAFGIYHYNRCGGCQQTYKTYKKYPYLDEESLEEVVNE